MTSLSVSPSSPGRKNTATSPKISGDELFVPASHVLVIDQEVSHPAFRLWCILHRLWFLHEPPTMDLLQNLMGTKQQDKATQTEPAKKWQPATRRSIERWLTELEQAGWLVWVRREESTRRYHLRTSARNATETSVLSDLRSLLNSGRTTLADIQTLLQIVPTPEATNSNATANQQYSTGICESSFAETAYATPRSHDPPSGSQPDETRTDSQAKVPTVRSHSACCEACSTTLSSQHEIAESFPAISVAHHATPRSQDTSAESSDTTYRSNPLFSDGFTMSTETAPYTQILHTQIPKDSPPPSTQQRLDDDDGLTATERFLLHEGFSSRAATEFRMLPLSLVQADVERRSSLGQGIGAIVCTWRRNPPKLNEHPASPILDKSLNAKAQALTLAPSASSLEIQYLALDLEEGIPPEMALQNLQKRRAHAAIGGKL